MKHLLLVWGIFHPLVFSVYDSVLTNNSYQGPGLDIVDSFSHEYLSKFPAVVEATSRLPPYWYVIAGMIAVLIPLTLLLYHIFRLQRHVGNYRHRNASQIRFIRSLLDLCYVYRESPHAFLDKFKDKVNIRQLKSYHLIDVPNNDLPGLKEDERLLYTLIESGFTQRELCVIFNLKKINNLYVKYHRIKKKLDSD